MFISRSFHETHHFLQPLRDRNKMYFAYSIIFFRRLVYLNCFELFWIFSPPISVVKVIKLHDIKSVDRICLTKRPGVFFIQGLQISTSWSNQIFSFNCLMKYCLLIKHTIHVNYMLTDGQSEKSANFHI